MTMYFFVFILWTFIVLPFVDAHLINGGYNFVSLANAIQQTIRNWRRGSFVRRKNKQQQQHTKYIYLDS